jgi:hypothetical protein
MLVNMLLNMLEIIRGSGVVSSSEEEEVNDQESVQQHVWVL